MMKKGMSLLEIILSISLISIFFGFTIPLSIRYLNISQVRDSELLIRTQLRLARANAVSGYQDSSWSVYLSGSNATIFQGINYATRNTNYDQIVDLRAVSFSSPITVSFAAVSGLSTAQTISPTGGKSVSINNYGLITN